MSEPAGELPADSPAVAEAAENARRGVITHLTVTGKRVAAIVPESFGVVPVHEMIVSPAAATHA
jgi:hypothetical protein